MEIKDKPKTERAVRTTNAALIAVLVMLVCLAVIIATFELSKFTSFKFIADHRNAIVSIELTVFVMTLVESIGRVIIVSFRRRGIEHVGHSIRTVIRGGVYIILTVSVVSTLSSNPVLAISLGTVTGIIIGFATQNLVSNVVAGVTLAIVRPVQVGDEVTVSGSTGYVKDIALIYTVLDTDDSVFYVPSIVMLSNVVMKTKHHEDKVE